VEHIIDFLYECCAVKKGYAKATIIWLSFILLIFILSSCTAIGNFADSIGSHLPTIGEPCNHWQCVTSSGQQKSEEVKRAEQKKQ
jgi:hypothetical protein